MTSGAVPERPRASRLPFLARALVGTFVPGSIVQSLGILLALPFLPTGAASYEPLTPFLHDHHWLGGGWAYPVGIAGLLLLVLSYHSGAYLLTSLLLQRFGHRAPGLVIAQRPKREDRGGEGTLLVEFADARGRLTRTWLSASAFDDEPPEVGTPVEVRSWPRLPVWVRPDQPRDGLDVVAGVITLALTVVVSAVGWWAASISIS